MELNKLTRALSHMTDGNAIKLGSSVYRIKGGQLQQRMELYHNNKPTGKKQWYACRIDFNLFVEKTQTYELKVMKPKAKEDQHE